MFLDVEFWCRTKIFAFIGCPRKEKTSIGFSNPSESMRVRQLNIGKQPGTDKRMIPDTGWGSEERSRSREKFSGYRVPDKTKIEMQVKIFSLRGT